MTVPSDPTRDQLLALHRRMVEIRAFEGEVERLFMQSLVRGSTHLYQGQEAVAVGACSALRAGDTMTCTYRGHGAVLAMGAPADRCMAEILGKAGGVCAGMGGSMHLTDREVGALGSFAIVGAHLPFACGTALAAAYRGTDDVSLTMFGDGATNIGAFHEAMNLAAIWRLPVIFVCENNLYGEYSPLAATTPVTRLSERGASYAMESVTIDGNDVLAVRAETVAAVARARAGEGPTFLEALTYRQRGHSRSDPGAYRPDGELDRWLDRDPIALFETELVSRGVADDAMLASIRSAVDAEMSAMSRQVRDWPAPEAAARLRGVLA
jgi:acetoin:2,6-dichlorophenolindophenol oxidoreductase subunit alpha